MNWNDCTISAFAAVTTSALLLPMPALAWLMDTPLASSDASFLGEAADNFAGMYLACAGDVDGDGYDDFLIGARGNDESGTDAGQAYLVFGQPTGWAMDAALSTVDASFLGEAPSSHAGGAVSGAGDVDGDGLDDFLIGAYYDSEAGNHAGQVYLVLGRPSGWAMDTSLATADASFLGEADIDYAGLFIDGAGDVNGDGYDDILIAAPQNSEAGTRAGQTYVIFGGPAGWAMDTSLGAADASFVGEASLDYSGWSVSGGGDLNGDGYDDLLIAASQNSEAAHEAGQVYVVFGAVSGWSMDTSLASADASFLGEGIWNRAGYSLSSAGDVNGDGYSDVLIGNMYNHEAGNYAGQAYLVFGGPTGWAMDTSLASVGASFTGEAVEDRAGQSVSGVGDVDADGYDDLLIGAFNNSEAAQHAGQAYLILGKASGWAMDTSLSLADASFLGEFESDLAGYGIAGAGDVDGDGYHDLLIGAHGSDEFGDFTGKAYLIVDDAPPCADADGDGYGAPGDPACPNGADEDCDDADAAVNPGEPEVACDYFDNNCDGILDPHEIDDDGDGVDECGADQIVGTADDDCDDGDAGVHPAASEVTCDGIDNDCDGLTEDEPDTDGDGYSLCVDCDDADPAVNPGAIEQGCDDIDNDCDGNLHPDEVDNDGDGWSECLGDPDDTDPSVYPGATEIACDYLDNDGDGHLHPEEMDDDGDGVDECQGDCDDAEATTHPGADEYCDQVDNDCDGATDEDEAVDVLTWYQDLDGDGFGYSAVTDIDCSQPPGFVGNDGDCDDLDFYVNPGAEEVCNGVDDDCDPMTDEAMDDDGDGFSICDGDCDESDPDVNPDALEECDGIDNDCDETTHEDVDADGDMYTICEDDCDDDDDLTFPGAPELCDGIDNDCDEVVPEDEEDLDGDGYLPCGLDCDDNDASVYDGAMELCDGIDNDCDGTIDEETDDDLDGDGFTVCQGDCDNGDPLTYPSAPEQCDGSDNDCDGTIDEDVDEDLDGDGFNACQGDCDNGDPATYPGASELCDGADNDCDGELHYEEADFDGDGYFACEDDCDDAESDINPEAVEVCDGVDNDCDGNADDVDQDGDGYVDQACGGEDCDDTDPGITPEAMEICDDGVDNDCDGLVDDDDPGCFWGDDDTADDDDVSDDDDSAEEGGCECESSQAPFPTAQMALFTLLGSVALRRRRK
jgi:hypothetical protein